MPILLAVNRNIAVLGPFEMKGVIVGILPIYRSMNELDEGEVKTRSKINIETNLHL